MEFSDKNLPFLPKTKYMTELKFSGKLVGKKTFTDAATVVIYGERI